MNVDPITLELELAEASVDVEHRTISGTLVPFGETGVAMIDGAPRRLRYVAGEHVPLRARTPLVLGHDEERPVGVLAELAPSETAIAATFRVDRTPDGDAALEQAASGSRGGLSVGALATRYRELEDGTLEVHASVFRHVGLVGVPAFESANVSSVAAIAADSPTEGGSTVETTETTTTDAAEVTATVETTPQTVTAAAPQETEERPVVFAARERTPEITAGALILAMLAAERGDRDAARLVEAALTTVVSTDVPGLMPAAQTNEILGGISVERTLASRVCRRAPLPATGMTISKPKWDTLPQGGWRATVPGAGEDDAIATNKPAVSLDSIDVLEWAYGVSLSYAVATRSTPDAIEAIYRAAVQDYYKAVEQKIAALLVADATATAAGAGIGAAVAASYSADVNAPTAPELLIVAPDIYGDLLDAMDAAPTYWVAQDGGLSSRLGGQIAGMEVVVSPYLAAGTEIVGPRGGIELRETDPPVRLTANTIGALQVELGVTAFATFDDEAAAGSYQQLTPAAGFAPGSSVAKATARKSSSRK